MKPLLLPEHEPVRYSLSLQALFEHTVHVKLLLLPEHEPPW